MYPSSARLLVAALEDPSFHPARSAEIRRYVDDWEDLAEQVQSRYSLDLRALSASFVAEQHDYALRQAWQGLVPETAGVGEAQTLLEVDMHAVQNADLFGWERQIAISEASEATPVHALVGWFDVRFCAEDGKDRGDGASAASDPTCVELSTAPTDPPTHWAHTTVPLQPPLTTPSLHVGLTQSKRSHHDLNLTLTYADDSQPVRASFAITAEFRGDRSTDEEFSQMPDEGEGFGEYDEGDADGNGDTAED